MHIPALVSRAKRSCGAAELVFASTAHASRTSTTTLFATTTPPRHAKKRAMHSPWISLAQRETKRLDVPEQP
jgi:hypothetical protein